MANWKDYKNYVKEIKQEIGKDIEEVEAVSRIPRLQESNSIPNLLITSVSIFSLTLNRCLGTIWSMGTHSSAG
ncbi:MAG TPA: hypothetical protein PLZ06_05065 [Clostridia bacterium]|mgnify:CR=1 FL=1|nr:hypothetical protein [Clostridia bacterium]